MPIYEVNAGICGVQYTDPVTCTTRKFGPGETFYAQQIPLANLDPSSVTVTDPAPMYGSLIRREFVETSDYGSDYVTGSVNQVRLIDEFVGVGSDESLSGKTFKRTVFYYRDATRPTQWTALFETRMIEP